MTNSKLPANAYSIGEHVCWKWYGGLIHGKVEEVYTSSVEIPIKDKLIKRNGSVEKPAYLVRSKAGNLAVKLHTELQKAPNRNFEILDNPKFLSSDE